MLPTGILIITYNSAAHVGQCLDAVARVRDEQDPVLVIDNHSSDDTAAIVRGYDGVTLLVNDSNLGFAGAVNQGFRHFGSLAGQVLLLNPDVLLQTPLTALVEACREYGLAAGRLTDPDGTTQRGFSARRFPTPATLVFETLGINRVFPSNPVNQRYRYCDLDYTTAACVDQPAGALLMIRSTLWGVLGGFDVKFYPVWFEDVDFCLRAAQSGFKARYIPTVAGIHAGGHSVRQLSEARRRVCWYASLLRYSQKHFRGLGRGLAGGGVLIAGLVRAAAAEFPGSPKAVRSDAVKSWMTVARLGFNCVISQRIRSAQPMDSPEVQDHQELTAEAAYGRGDGGKVDSSAINNTERSLKRLHAR